MTQGKLLVVHDPERHDLTVRLLQGSNTQSADPVSFVNPMSPADRAELRWYLEDYLRFPVVIYPDRARRVEEKMAQWGGALFDHLFGAGKARDFYTLVKNAGLKQFDFEVHYQAAEARNFPWELLYDTSSRFYLAHQFASFLRAQEGTAAELVQPHQADEQLRVLLVIARPYGGRDVPYRTVARPVTEVLQRPTLRSRIHVEVLRPPTFKSFVEAVSRTREDGGPFFDVVHFDGHGGFGFDPADAGRANAFEMYKGPHGKLLFETAVGKEHAVDAADLRKVLGQHRVPLMVLNACRSGMEALEDEKAQSLLQAAAAAGEEEAQKLKERLSDQDKAIVSVAGTLLDAGAHGVVGMGYIVYAHAAALFMRGFYERLLSGGTAAAAVSAGRLALEGDRTRPTRFGGVTLQDWLVPVYHQRVPVQLFAKPAKGTKRKGPAPEDFLPAPQFGFLGRDAELLHIERALSREGVAGVTLTGLGGTGKTALALGCACWLSMTHAPQAAGGIFFFAFADKDDEGRTFHPNLAALIRAVGRQLHGDRFLRKGEQQQRDVVTAYLQETPSLLVLDNAEAVCGLGEQPALLNDVERDEFRRFLRRVCAPQGATRLLLTSRREEPWLGLNTEALEVEGLNDEAAGELALAVLRHSVGATVLEEKLKGADWQRDYDALLNALGGHPLALQIILPHLKARTPGEVLRSLSEGANWLDGRLPQGGSDRERTLAGCINYSFAALPEATRALLPVLAYFREWAQAEHLAALCAEEDVPPPIRGVTAQAWTEVLLQAQATGLVTRQGATSPFKLHPLLPWFLHVTLRGDESAAIQTAARRHFVSLASALETGLEGGKSTAAVQRFVANRASLLSALALARQARDCREVATLYGCLNTFMGLAGERGQLEVLRDALIEEWRPAPPLDSRSEQGRLWLTLQLHCADAHMDRHDPGKAEEVYRQLLADSPGDEAVEAVAYHNLGRVAQERHDLGGAQKWYRKALEIKLRLGDEHGAATTYHNLGMVAQGRHDLGGAQKWYRKALEIKLRLGDEHGAALTYHNLGMVAQGRHDLGGAQKWYRKALEIKLRLGDEHGAASTYGQMGAVAQERHALGRAQQWWEKALEVFLRLGDEHAAAKTYYNLGTVAQERHDLVGAQEWYGKALEVFLRLGDEHGAALTYHILGVVAQLRHDLVGAQQRYEKALEVFLRLGDEHTAAQTCHQLGNVAQRRRDLVGAQQWYEKALEVFLRLGDEHAAAQTYHNLGRVAQGRHDLGGAQRWYEKALKVFLRLGDEHTAAQTFAQMGLLGAERRDAVCANHTLQAIRRFSNCNDFHSVRRALAQLRDILLAGITCRQAAEQAWQTEMGQPMPTDIAAVLFSPAEREQGESPSSEADHQ